MLNDLGDRSVLFASEFVPEYLCGVMHHVEQCHNPSLLSCVKGARRVPSSQSRS